MDQILRAVVVGVVLYLIYLVVTWVAAAIGLPSIIVMVVAVLLVIAFIYQMLKIFGINF